MINKLGIAKKVTCRASLRYPARSSEFLGDDAVSDRAENALIKIMDSLGLQHEKAIVDAAIYGSKLDMQFQLVNGKAVGQTSFC